MTAAQDIAAGLRGLDAADDIGTFNLLVAKALAELLDPSARTAPARGSETVSNDQQPPVTFVQVMHPKLVKAQVTDPPGTDF